ncbi:MAG: hypothetical protein GY859_22025 [Desulfobacterales bacterium]|nr:hypothetical protein [Desulfobacterales bacterium]
MKKIWLTSLSSDEQGVKKFMTGMKTYGLEVAGHFWENDLEKAAWIKPRDELIDAGTALWAIMGSAGDLRDPEFRYGLSLLAITVQARRGAAFPMVMLQTGPAAPDVENLPTPLANVEVLSAGNPALGAKLVAKVHTPPKASSPAHRLDMYGSDRIGQWFEVGPVNEQWSGVMFGASGAEITFHAVGPAGGLPDKSTLHYPMKGLTMTLGEKEYTAWAARNELDPASSYFVQVKGFPDSILFGPYATEDSADVFVVTLK